jgi:hypothetical protein
MMDTANDIVDAAAAVATKNNNQDNNDASDFDIDATADTPFIPPHRRLTAIAKRATAIAIAMAALAAASAAMSLQTSPQMP